VELADGLGDEDVEVPRVGEYDYEVPEREEEQLPQSSGYLPQQEVAVVVVVVAAVVVVVVVVAVVVVHVNQEVAVVALSLSIKR